MKFRDIYSRAPFIENSLPPEDVEDREPVRSAQEASEPEPGEVERIVQSWSETLDMKLNPEHVKKHLETLRRWQSRLQRKEDGLL